MTNYSKHYAKHAPTATPQTEPIPTRTDQVENNAGGFVFSVGDWGQLDRFLLLGSTGSYYASARKITIDNAKVIEKLILEDGPRVVARIVEISDAGRAPKNDPALFALALCASAADVGTRRLALQALTKVARIGTHLFTFAEYVNAQRGWGRALRNGIAQYYLGKPVEKLAYDLVKYQQRGGWSHRDMLRLSHPRALASEHHGERARIFDWVCGRKEELGGTGYSLLRAYDYLKANPTVEVAVDAINTLGLPREGIPTELLNDKDVWRALLGEMPMTALIRNLGKMTAIGVLEPMNDETKAVVASLGNENKIRRSRLHPLTILIALKTYAQGHGDKGSLHWTPVQTIVDALDKAFYLAFQNVVPTGKRIMIALDVSGSMTQRLADSSITAAEGAAAIALVTAATEPNHMIMAFDQGIRQLEISPRMRLDDVLAKTRNVNGGGTDCALPWKEALKHGWALDAVVSITDNETWAGERHPCEAVKNYRAVTGIPARNIVIGMTSTGFTVNDPTDPLGLDVVGFDTAVPALISDFIRG